MKQHQLRRLSSWVHAASIASHSCRLDAGCDPSILVERLPDCYLLSSEKTLHQMASMMTLLEGQLAGADIVGMVHEDPGLLLLDIEHGIKQFQQLWDVDSTVLEDSDPTELALAVRHLCAAGRD